MPLRKFILILFLSGVFAGIFPWTPAVPEAKAIDPVTLAILTPIAIKGAQIAAPYVLRGLKNMGKAFIKIFPDLFRFCKFPIGLFAVMFGWPFGYAGQGLKFMGQGLLAPLQMCFHILILPISMFGIGVS